MVARRRFTPEFKAQVVLEVISGIKTAAEASREYRLQSPVLSRWKSEFLENAARVFEGDEQHSEEAARLMEMERLVGRLTMELEIAKKPPASWPRSRAETGDSHATGPRIPGQGYLPGDGLCL